MGPEEMAAVFLFSVFFLSLFLTYFVHNVSAPVSYDQKVLMDIRAAITHFKEQDAKDLLQTPNKAQIPVICIKNRPR